MSEGSDEDEAWIDEVRNYVNSAQPTDHPKRECTIFKVPKHIRELDTEAYEPLITFFGPFHHNRGGSSFMNYHKRRCVGHLLLRHRSPEHASQLLKQCLLELKKHDKNVRSCYSAKFSELSAQKMALIMLLDGCFIIYLMLNIRPGKESWIKKEREKEKEIAKETQEEAVGKLKAKATEEDEGKKRREYMMETREGDVVLNIKEKDKKRKGIAKKIEEGEVGKLEGEATEEDERKKRRERMIETREGEVVLNIKEKDKKRKGIAKKIEEGEVGKLEGEATEEDERKKRRERMIETREGEVVLNIEEEDEQFEGPTEAGLFTIDVVVYDLLKLENQIPFFVIQLLFDHLKACEDGPNNLVDLALRLFGGICPKESKSFEKKSPGEYHHLLHLFYSSRIPSKKPAESTSAPERIPELIKRMWKKAKVDPSRGSPTSAPSEAAPSQGASTSAPTSKSIQGCIELMPWRKAEVDPPRRSPTTAPKWIPSATELDRAGVKFERNEQADSFLDIKFQKRKMNLTPWLCLRKLFLMLRSGRMEIPPLQIYDYTGPLFRNLIAFEQCYFDTEMYITIYALFMDCIIDQAEDVRLLYLRGILEHGLSNDQAVADLINKLRGKIHHFPEKNYLLSQIDEVHNFYEVTWHKRVAALRRDYCGSPWATISVLAAACLLLLTVEQALFSAMSYVHPLQKG